MGTIADVRAKYPGTYDDLTDEALGEALYTKFYSDMDRREFDAKSGLKPYQNALEATATAIGNAPARVASSITGLGQADAEVLNQRINSLAEVPDQYAGATERPPIFEDVARNIYGTKEIGETDAIANELWARFQDPAQRAEVLKEMGTISAETSLRMQLERQELQAGMAPLDTAPGSIEGYVAGAIGSVAEMTPALAASIASRNPLPAMVFAGGYAGGSAYGEGRDQGLSPDDARKYATLYAAAEGLPEALPISVILKEGGPLLARLAKGAATEAIQEGFTEALQFAVDKGFISPDMPWSEAWPRIKDAAITGALAGPAMAGIAAGTQKGMATAADVSQRVLGPIAEQGANVIKGGFANVAEMTERLKGSPLQERIDAFAQMDAMAPDAQAAATVDPAVAATDAIPMADITYTNQEAKRSLPLQSELAQTMQTEVAAVFGPGYKIEVMSGGQGEGSNGTVGSRRHDHGNAGDVWIIGPDGKRVEGDALLPLATKWIEAGHGSVGFPSNGQSLHLDLIGGSVPLQAGEGRSWFYGEPSEAQRAALEGAAGKAPASTGKPMTTIDRIIGIESGGDPTAQNPNSSAGGLGQFIDSTWLSTVRKHAPELSDLTDDEILSMKKLDTAEGVEFQRRMLEAHTQDNATALLNAGVEATDGNLYLAHFLGQGGALKALAADPAASVRSIMGDAVIEANPFLADMTVADMVRWAGQKMGSSAGVPIRSGGNGPGTPRAQPAASQQTQEAAPAAQVAATQETPPASPVSPVDMAIAEQTTTPQSEAAAQTEAVAPPSLLRTEPVTITKEAIKARTTDLGSAKAAVDETVLQVREALSSGRTVTYTPARGGEPVAIASVDGVRMQTADGRSIGMAGIITSPNARLEISGDTSSPAILSSRLAAERARPPALPAIVANAQAQGVQLDVSQSGKTATISRIEIPSAQRNNGTGTRTMQELTRWADANGVTLRLTPSTDFGGSSVKRLTDFYKRLGFVENKGKAKDFASRETMYREPATAAPETLDRGAPKKAATPTSAKTAQAEKPRPADEPQTWDELEQEQPGVLFRPMPGFIPAYQESVMPQRPADNQVAVTGGNTPIGETPTKRDEPRKKLLAIVGDRIYQQRIAKRRGALGYYKVSNSEIRIKRYDDIEVMAHEAMHYLDFDKKFGGRFTALRRQFAAELDPLSYTNDPQLINIEGFAEFGRLWATNYQTAVAKAPQFTKAFEKALADAKLLGKMKAFQKSAHRWYFQGTLAQFRGKSGESDNQFDRFNGWMRSRPGERFLQNFVDAWHGAKIIERETTGKIDLAANSAWKLYRMTAGAESMVEAIIMDGTPQLMPDGSYGFRGKSLADVFKPTTGKRDGFKRFDALMEYFKARRAAELMGQGRENLFTAKEIRAGLDLANTYSEFPDVFADWQTFNSEMLDFYVDMELITPDQRAAFAKNNTEYVPFHRVLDVVGAQGAVGNTNNDIKKRLFGGEQNTREIAENIVNGLSANVMGALQARAKAQLFRNIKGGQEGSSFAVEIAAGSKPLKVALEQYKSRFAEIMLNLGYEVELNGNVVKPNGNAVNAGAPINMDDVETLLNNHPELLQFWQHNQKPSSAETHIEPVNIGGKTRWFEVRAPLLVAMLTAPRGAPLIVKMMAVPRRVLTTAITSMPQFMVPNLVRDTVSAGALTQSKFRPFVESGRGVASYVRQSQAFKDFRLNGGLFGGRLDEGSGVAAKERGLWKMGVPAANMWDQAGRGLARTTRVAAPFEQGTRIGQFERAVELGINPLEAAFQGREISTDFAQMGRNEVWRWILQTIPFANAGLQGIDQMIRNTMQGDTGKVRLDLKSARKLGVQAFTKAGLSITVLTILLWLMNHDDERYLALTPDEKARFWHLWLPNVGHVQIPKPYGVGFIFADLPEIALDFAQNRDGSQAAGQLAFGLAQHFWFLDYPGFLQPYIEAITNRKFTGAPIIPPNLKDVDPEYQFTDRTPEVYRQLGQTFGVSPLMTEHYVKGFTGYLEAYMVDATEFLLWDTEKWGPRPFSRGPIDYFTSQFNGKEVPFRTKWTEGYYDLKQRAAGKAATYRHLFNMSQRDQSQLTKFTQNEVNLMLRELNGVFSKVDNAFADTNAMLMAIKYNPDLTREQKEEQTDAFYALRNKELGNFYRQAQTVVERLESGIDQAKP